MLFLQSVLQVALLASAVLGSSCKTAPSSCKSIATNKASSTSCSKFFSTKGIGHPTCTKTVTKAAVTTTKYTKKGKSTRLIYTKTSTAYKTVRTACETVTLPTTIKKAGIVHKTSWETCTELDTVKVAHTSCITKTKTITKTTTIIGKPSANALLKRSTISTPKACSCFVTKSKTTTHTPARKTKTVSVATATVTKSTTKKVTQTKTIAVARITKWSTHTSQRTSTTYKVTTKHIKVTSTTSVYRKTTTKTSTKWVTVYKSTQKATTVTRVATGGSGSKTTVFPTDSSGHKITDGSVKATVITFKVLPAVTITKAGSKLSTTTILPTGAAFSAGTGTRTVVVYVTRATKHITKAASGGGPSHSTIIPTNPTLPATVIDFVTRGTVSKTSPAVGDKPSATTIIPTNPTIPATVIDYVTRGTISLTSLATNGKPSGTTIIPSNPTEPATVISWVTQLTTSLTSLATGSTPYATTLEPSNPTDPVTVVTYVVQSTVTYTSPAGPAGPSGTTIYPPQTNIGAPVQVITYVARPTTSITVPITGTVPSATTIFPTDGSGKPLTDASIPVSVITYSPLKRITTTEPLPPTATEPSATTIFPTDVGGLVPISVITYTPLKRTTITTLGSVALTTTKYPTDGAGNTITDGSGTISVIYVITQPETLITRVNSVTGLTTLYPTNAAGSTITDGTGTKTIITYVIQKFVTVSKPGTAGASTSTAWPTDGSGHIITTGIGPITVIDFLPRSIVTLSRPMLGTSACPAPITPTDPAQPLTIIECVNRPSVTITEAASTTGLTTVYPTDTTDYKATVTVITFANQPQTLITRVGSSTGLTTLWPTNSLGSTITDGTGTKTIITFVTQATITTTVIGPSDYTSTFFPTNSVGSTITDGSVPVSVVIGEKQPFTTITKVDTTVYTSTVYPTNNAGSTIRDPSVPITIVVGVTQPVTTIHRTATGTIPSTTTIYPASTDIHGTITVIDYDVGAATTLTSVGKSVFTTTEFPTNSNGVSVTDGSFGTRTVVVYITQPVTTVISVGTSAYTTTVTPNPTDILGTISVIDYVTQPVISITSVASTPSVTTIFPNPTDMHGTITVIYYTPRPTTTIDKLADGGKTSATTLFPDSTAPASVPVTVIDWLLQPVTSVTEYDTTTGLTTVTPPGSSGTITVITFAPLPTVTSTTLVSTPFTSTIFPPNIDQDRDGHIPVSVIIGVTRSITTITTMTNSLFTSTKYPPTDAPNTVPITVIVGVEQPYVTVTKIAEVPYTSTAYPTNAAGSTLTGPSDTITIVIGVKQPITTVTSPGSSAYTTTEYPTDSNGHIITDLTGTITVIDYVPGGAQPRTTATRLGSSAFLTTIFPTNGQGVTLTGPTDTISVIQFITEPQTLITRVASTTGLTTLLPTDGSGKPITDGSGTATVITFITPPVVTLTSLASTTGLKTLFPTNNAGSTITDGSGTETVVTYITQPQVLITRVAPTTGLTTLLPTGPDGNPLPSGSGTKTVVTFITQPVVTVTSLASTTGLTTLIPTDGSGKPITDGSGTDTIVTFITQPQVLITRVAQTTGLTTILPTGPDGSLLPSGTKTVITFITQPVVTVTSLASTTGLTTLIPTDGSGKPITDGSGTDTVVTFITQPQVLITRVAQTTGLTTLLPTGPNGSLLPGGTKTIITFVTQPEITLTSTDRSTHITTFYPTDSTGQTITDGSQPLTIVTYVIPGEQPIVTVTRVAPTTGLTTLFPTDSSGSTITDSTGTKTVITFVTQPTVTISLPATNGVDSITTLFPVDNNGVTVTTPGTGTVTVIDYVTQPIQPITTITKVGTTPFTSTFFPTDNSGHTVTDPSVPITVVVQVTQSITTILKVGTTDYTSTFSPTFPTNSAGVTVTDPSVPITVVIGVEQPITTVTTIALSSFTTTAFPTNAQGSTITDDSGTISVIIGIPRPTVTVTSIGPSAFTSTITPTGGDALNPTVPATVIIEVPQLIVTVTSPGPSKSTTTVFPIDGSGHTITDGTGTITVIDFEPLGTVTVTQVGPSAGLTTLTPANPTDPVTVVTFIAQPITTIALPSDEYNTITVQPTDSLGNIITDGTGTITVIDYFVPNLVTITSVGSVPSFTTIYPSSTDSTIPGTVVEYVVQPTTTVTSPIASGTISTSYVTTYTPNPTDVQGVFTVVNFKPANTTPDRTCNNTALEVAIYQNPYLGVASPSWTFEYFGTVAPYDTTTSNIIGINWINGGTAAQNKAGLSPYGFTPNQAAVSGGYPYVLNLRGYFYAPKTQTYIFSLYNTDDIAAFWIGDNAYDKWSSSNVDMTTNGQLESKTLTKVLTAGSYTPIRIMFGTNGATAKFSFDCIGGTDGTPYIRSGTASSYLVADACDDDTADPYPDFGYEFPAPDNSCSNGGLGVASYTNIFKNVANTVPLVNIAGWDPTYFETAVALGVNATTTIGLDDTSRTAPVGFYHPDGIFALMYRGYFYAPFDGTYSFNISNMDDILQVWTGNKSVDGWDGTNIDVQGKLCTSCPAGSQSPAGSFSTFLSAGTFFPLRLLYGNGGSVAKFTLEVTDQDGFYYLRHGLPSAYFVQKDCDDLAPPFPEPLPAICGNAGLQIAIYNNPYASNNVLTANYNPAYFTTQVPFDTGLSSQIAVVAPGASPQGFTPNVASVYVMQYRGYFLAPATGTYIFSFSAINDILYFWTGDNAVMGFTKGNADGVAMRNGTVNGAFSRSYNLTAGQYFPVRIQHADAGAGGSFSFTVTNSAGNQYVINNTPSKFLVAFACNYDLGPGYPDWGAETPVPDTCGNLGMEAAIYGDPFKDSTPDNAAFKPEYFKGISPDTTTITRMLGIRYYQTGDNTEATKPLGLTPKMSLNYTLNYRGYFYVPKTSNYTFRISAGDNFSGFWIGNNAFSAYSRSNVDATSIWNGTVSSLGVVTRSLQADTYLPLRVMLGSWGGTVQYIMQIYDADGTYYVQHGVASPYLVYVGCDTDEAPPYNAWGQEGQTQPVTTINHLATGTQPASTTTIYPTDTAGSKVTTSGTITVVKYNKQAYVTYTEAGTKTTPYFVTVTPTDSAGRPITDGSAKATVYQHIPPVLAPGTNGPVYPCSKYGYIIINQAFYQVDLATSTFKLITAALNNKVNTNAIGYNVLDNYIYGIESTTGYVLRIAANAKVTHVVKIPQLAKSYIADIDGNGQYWVAHGGSPGHIAWYQVNLKPGSANYGKLVASGQIVNPGVAFADWVQIPSAGNKLWTLAINGQAHAVLVSITLGATKVLTIEATFSNWSGTAFGAMFATNNGDIYCKQNASGNIWKVNVFSKRPPVLVTAGPRVQNTDGCRCVYNNDYISG
ncbi:hypothetical protein TWF694_001050 [Orbilia ellipsospora]|uniref:PA14 domain-containing protein n=1 Tax=Orbilia ellipsospora TaxID=2528407 RepID=A0AAV9XT34_9PEZI